MAEFEFKPNPSGIRELLRLPGVRANLEARAGRVAAAANADSTTTGKPLTYEVRSETGRVRARAAVIAAGARTQAHEHQRHALGRALDHAR